MWNRLDYRPYLTNACLKFLFTLTFCGPCQRKDRTAMPAHVDFASW